MLVQNRTELKVLRTSMIVVVLQNCTADECSQMVCSFRNILAGRNAVVYLQLIADSTIKDVFEV